MFFLGKSQSLQRFFKQSPCAEQFVFLSTRSLEKEGPASVVRQKIANGSMRSDFKQAPIVNNLQEVYENIQNYTPGMWLSSKTPKGLYIYGSVGAGKTMLMDIFFNCVKACACLQTRSKRRSHFNNFMADVHSRIHKLKKKTKGSHKESNLVSDPISPIAKELVKEAWLLCFDEFQVTDIADAMILKTLFTKMFNNGMVMVATSNRAPDDLYKNGLQRSNFLPFIPVLKAHCKVVNINGKDYRITTSEGTDSHYLLLNDPGTKAGMESTFNKLCQLENKQPSPATLNVLGHKIVFKNACGRILYASFRELCDKPLSSNDYIQIAKHFDTILIKDVPILNLDKRNQARRFIILIDTLYDNKVRIQISAEADPKNLFSAQSGKAVSEDYQRILMDDLKIEKGSENDKASLFSGSEEVFAFQRTISRITEMCSNSYWNRHQKGR